LEGSKSGGSNEWLLSKVPHSIYAGSGTVEDVGARLRSLG